MIRVCLLRRILVYTGRWKWNVGGFDPWHPVGEAREEDRRDSEQSKIGLCNDMHNTDGNLIKIHKYTYTNTGIQCEKIRSNQRSAFATKCTILIVTEQNTQIHKYKYSD